MGVEAYHAALELQILQVLEQHYGGYAWHVEVHGGVADIRNLSLSDQMGFRVHVSSLKNGLHKIVQAGGEFLERYYLRRAQIDVDRLMTCRRNARGEVTGGDLSR